MQAQQIEKHDKNIKKTCAHLQQMRLQEKKYYDQIKNIINEILKKSNFVLLYDMQNVISYLIIINEVINNA